MRKAFNFYRSFYDVFNNIRRDEDKLTFINALLKKQFHNIDPEGLKDIPLFAYESQRQVIDAQVQGYIDKTGDELEPPEGGAKGAQQGGAEPPSVQEKGKEQEQEKDDVDEVIKHLSKVSGKNFSTKAKATKSMIRARLREGYSLNELKAVSTHRVKEWGNDAKMKKYIRPITLFNSEKFDGYLAEAKADKKSISRANQPRRSHSEVFGKKSD